MPVDHLDWPPTSVALIKQGLIASRELILLAEGPQREQALQTLIEVAKNGG